MDLGATLCTRTKPRCGECPVAADCVARRDGRVDELPSPRPRKPLPQRPCACCCSSAPARCCSSGAPPTGIWARAVEPARARAGRRRRRGVPCALRAGGEPVDVADPGVALPPIEHGFTHYRLTLHPQRVACGVAAARARTGSCGSPPTTPSTPRCRRRSALLRAAQRRPARRWPDRPSATGDPWRVGARGASPLRRPPVAQVGRQQRRVIRMRGTKRLQLALDVGVFPSSRSRRISAIHSAPAAPAAPRANFAARTAGAAAPSAVSAARGAPARRSARAPRRAWPSAPPAVRAPLREPAERSRRPRRAAPRRVARDRSGAGGRAGGAVPRPARHRRIRAPGAGAPGLSAPAPGTAAGAASRRAPSARCCRGRRRRSRHARRHIGGSRAVACGFGLSMTAAEGVTRDAAVSVGASPPTPAGRVTDADAFALRVAVAGAQASFATAALRRRRGRHLHAFGARRSIRRRCPRRRPASPPGPA